ncbi:MAG: RagB/SusD family nutrient uptake outer membrane protein, partial [Chitinophagaceae bacterium]
MNISRYSVILMLTTIVFFSACTKMEDRPLELITEEYLWDSKDSLGTNASYFLNDIYADLPRGFNRIGSNFLDAATDDAVPSEDNATIATFTNGGYSQLSNADNSWATNYASIRKCNLFVQNFPKVSLKQDLLIQGQYWKAENRFLRAMFYYELIKRYGGVPLLGDRVLTLSDDLKLPRSSFDASVDYVVSELDAIKNDLRPDPVSASDYGRITRAVALTLKAKILLLAASQLNNPANDLARWSRAKDAAGDVIRLNLYRLEISFSNVFFTRKNNEVILA